MLGTLQGVGNFAGAIPTRTTRGTRARHLDNKCEFTRMGISNHRNKRSTEMNWTEEEMGGGGPGSKNEEKLAWGGVAGSCPEY